MFINIVESKHLQKKKNPTEPTAILKTAHSSLKNPNISNVKKVYL